MRQLLNKAMIMVGLVLLVWGYVTWLTRHESGEPLAVLSFVYLTPGWALTTMGYIGFRLEGRGRLSATTDEQTRDR